jgi:hypothetical protein
LLSQEAHETLAVSMNSIQTQVKVAKIQNGSLTIVDLISSKCGKGFCIPAVVPMAPTYMSMDDTWFKLWMI